jgi:peptidoglycan/LPS O-acetylase OafA/YrhL
MAAKRLQTIQALRAVAALMVVSHHAATIPHGALPPGPTFAPLPALDEFGCAGVDIFFVISGFIIGHTIARADATPGAMRFLLRRIVRVAPLFWAACLATALFEWSVHGSWPALRSLINGATILPLSSVGTFVANPAPVYLSWTLGFELLFYLVMALSLASGGRRAVGIALAVSIALAALGLVAQFSWAPLAFGLNPIVAEFSLGLFASIVWERWPAAVSSRTAIAAGMILFAAGLVVNLGLNPDPAQAMVGKSSLIRTLVWGVPAFLLVLGSALDSRRQVGWLAARAALLGEASYAIYLIHPLVLYALHDAGLALLMPGKASFVAVALGASAAAGLLTYLAFERPLMRLLYRTLDQDRRWAKKPLSWPAASSAPIPG